MTKIGLTLGFLGIATFAGCAVEPEEDVGTGEGAARSTVSLKYEGTCEFLRGCSTYSRNLPVGQVSWGCTGRGACDDDALWVAGPTRSYCGRSVRICKGSRCTTALVKDVSVSHDWEASNGVMRELGLPFGLTSRCGGFGGGTVTVETDPTGGSSQDPQTSGDERDEDDGSCWSSTLGTTKPEMTCVQSQSNSVWYQCKNGAWYRGVEDGEGPYGPCASMHPL